MDELLTPEEVAAILKLKPRTVHHMLRRGDLLGVKLGRVWRIRETDVYRLLVKESNAEAGPDDYPACTEETGSMLLRDEILAAVDGLDNAQLAELLSYAKALQAPPVALSPDEERALAEAEAEVARGEVVPLREFRR
ncbi:MAG: helix-turn-helix domain-containing protein [Firmicutes bacterium]|nr:helix-turn-helix domain-containing protein [Bacillota bacterium]